MGNNIYLWSYFVNAFFWVIPRRLNNSDAGEFPRRTHTTFRNTAKFWNQKYFVKFFFLRMRNISDTICKENQNTHFVFNNIFFFENRTVYEMMWKNIVQPGMPHDNIWRTRIACWVTKATNTLGITDRLVRYVQYLLFFHCRSSSTNAPECYVICTSPVLFK
jgi:hypothetical protein